MVSCSFHWQQRLTLVSELGHPNLLKETLYIPSCWWFYHVAGGSLQKHRCWGIIMPDRDVKKTIFETACRFEVTVLGLFSEIFLMKFWGFCGSVTSNGRALCREARPLWCRSSLSRRRLTPPLTGDRLRWAWAGRPNHQQTERERCIITMCGFWWFLA